MTTTFYMYNIYICIFNICLCLDGKWSENVCNYEYF